MGKEGAFVQLKYINIFETLICDLGTNKISTTLNYISEDLLSNHVSPISYCKLPLYVSTLFFSVYCLGYILITTLIPFLSANPPYSPSNS